MTDEDLPEEPSARQFLTRRQRREYERARETAKRATGVQRTAHWSLDTLVRGDESQQLADDKNGAYRPTKQPETAGTQHPPENLATPQPLAVDDPGGLHRTPQRPSAQDQDQILQHGRYDPAQNVDLGGLRPLPEDNRDYPHLAEDVATLAAGREGDEESDESLLGYVLVADGTEEAPEVDEAALKHRRTRKRRRTVVMLSSFAVFLGLLAVVGLGVGQLVGLSNNDYAGPGGAEVEFEVHPGEGSILIGNRLVEEDIIASTGAFRDAVEASNSNAQIQPGEYTLRHQMPASDAVDALLGDDEPGVHYIYVNSGYRIDDVFENIAEQTGYTTDEIEQAAEPTDFGLPSEAETLEGYIAVGEYQFPIEASPDEILEQMIEPTMEEFDRLGVSDPEEQFRLVTIASMLEAEARPDDYAIVAGIIENRLNESNPETHGFLQIDATVIYGMGVRQLQFSAEDRQDESNPYNTYVHRGLPPGPIGAPSTAALDAAADPEDSDYYYWVTTNIETGETKFSTTLEQHLEYQEEYREYCDENPDICGRG